MFKLIIFLLLVTTVENSLICKKLFGPYSEGHDTNNGHVCLFTVNHQPLSIKLRELSRCVLFRLRTDWVVSDTNTAILNRVRDRIRF